MNSNEDQVPITLRIIATGVYFAFWLWRILAATLLGAFVGGILFLQLDQGTWAKVCFFTFTFVGLVVGILIAESSRRRAKGSVPVMEHLYTSHDLDRA